MSRWIIGLAAGASLDGVEAAVVEITGDNLDLQVRVTHWLVDPFARDLRDLLIKACTPDKADVRQISLAHRLLGEALASAARRLADSASLSLAAVLCVGCLGLTAWQETDGRLPSHLGLGSTVVVAERTGLTTISDFRARDLVCGGQGSPIQALSDHVLFRDPLLDRVVLHLGGLAQAVYRPAGDDPEEMEGCEVGPCTVLLDSLIEQLTGGKERCDAGGRSAVQGRQIPELLGRWMNHPFVLRRGPKSAHRSFFAEEFARHTVTLAQQNGWGFHDVLCTANHFVANLAATSIRRLVPEEALEFEVILTGRGTRNGLLWRLLKERLPEASLSSSDALGIPTEAKEAVDAALLAALTLDGVPANVPRTTGAGGTRLLGHLTPGSTSNWHRCLAWMTGQREAVFQGEE